MLAFGLSGDVGAGKSTLARLWRERGASVLDADEVVRALWTRADVLRAAVSRWGEEILDAGGRAVPSLIASKAFADLEEYKWLCALLHPLVRIEMERAASSLEGWVVAEIPLLFEGGEPWWIDATIYVTAPEEKRRERNAVRGWKKDEIARREAFLLPGGEKRARADLVIDNGQNLGRLIEEGSRLAERFRRLSGLARASVFFPDRESACVFSDLLRRKGLGTEFLLREEKGAEKGERKFTLDFFTLERWFCEISEVLSAFPGANSLLVRPRRLPWSYRNTLSEALRP
ncbi:MAG: dephospho-CoA kinase [Synergistaceae bacterium]|nr:dephospho-CoA kinase [Synergistaceae bacterium]